MNIFQISAMAQQSFSERMAENGHETKTTFYGDFTIADCFGVGAVKDTFKNAFSSWKNDLEYVTELYVVLNWKIWEHYNKGNEVLAKLYDEMWRKVGCYVYEHFTDKESQQYFFEMTD